MPAIADAGRSWLRDFKVDAVPSSGLQDPDKIEGRRLFVAIDSALASIGLTGAVSVKKATRAALFGDLTPAAEALAIVYGDTTASFNGLYVKAGASGVGSWAKTALALPSDFAAQLAEVLPLIGDLDASVTAAQAAAGDAAYQAVSSGGARDEAEAARDAVLAVADTTGLDGFYATKADASAALGGLPPGAVVMVFEDETLAGDRALYQKASGVLALRARMTSEAARRTVLTGTPADKGALADDTTNDRPAILAAAADYGALNLTPLAAGGRYRMDTAAPSDFEGVPIRPRGDASLSLPTSIEATTPRYALMAELAFAEPGEVYFRDKDFSNRFPASPDPVLKPNPGLLPPVRRMTAKALGGTAPTLRSFEWTEGTAWATISATATDAAGVTFNTVGGAFVGAFIEIGVGETVRQVASALPGVAQAVGVIVRGVSGFAVIYNIIGTDGLATRGYKLGSAVPETTTDLDWPNRGQNTVFRFENCEWSVTRLSASRVLIKANGHGIALTGAGLADVGDIQEVGIAVFATDNAACTFGGNVVEQSDHVLGLPRCSAGALFGDSTCEDMASAWGRLLPDLMDGYQGVQLGPIRNYGAASTTTQEAFDAMQATGALDGANWVVLCSGTNDIQGGTNRATFTTLVGDVCDYVQGLGKQLVWVVPYLWYDTEQADGSGMDTLSAEAGAWYRSEIMRICAAKGVRYVDATSWLGNPDPTQRLEPRGGMLLRDNIHQTSRGHHLYALAIAEAVLDQYTSLPERYSSLIWGSALAGGSTAVAGSPVGYDAEGGRCELFGLLDLAAITDGTAILTLPRHLRPARTVRRRILAFNSGGSPLAGSPFVTIGADGAVILQGAPAGSTRIALDGVTLTAA